MSEVTDALALVFSAPVSAAAPAGTSVRYDPEFDTLKEEIDKLSSPSSAGDIDWRRVVDAARSITAAKSKDLLVASYLCVGLFQRDGYAALAPALRGLQGMVEAFWPALFPELGRLRARIAAAEWLVERLTAQLRYRAPEGGDGQAIADALDALEVLEAAFTERFAGEGPSFGDLRAALRERAEQVPKPQPATAPASEASSATTIAATERAAPEPAASAPAPRPASGPAPQAPALPSDLGAPEARDQALKAQFAALKTLAAALRKASSADPLAYQLARVAGWGRVKALPPHVEGTTRVPAGNVGQDAYDRLAALAAAGDWPALLEQSERQYATTILWLDLQYFVHRALTGLGAEHQRARHAVEAETGALVRSFPGLLDLCFDNGFPFAAAETRDWAHGLFFAAPASGGAPAAAPAARPAAEADEAFADAEGRAREALRAGRTTDAIAILDEATRTAVSRRQRFARRLALARTLAEIKETRLAVAWLDVLDQDVRAFRLEEWEPQLAADALGLLYQCQRTMLRGEWKNVPDAQQRADELYARLAQVAPAAALVLKA